MTTISLREVGPAAAAGVSVAILYSALSLALFWRMRAGIDLAIFGQAVKRYAEWKLPWSEMKAVGGFNLLGDHFSPIIALAAPIYAAVPHVWILLVIQAALIGLTTFLIAYAATRWLGVWPGVAIGLVYGLAWGTQGLALFDFHEVAFALPLLAMAYIAIVRERFSSALWWAMPLMLVKEDSVFLILGIALVLAARRQYRLAAVATAYAIVSFALIVGVIIPAIGYYGRYTYWGSSAVAGGNPLVHAFQNLTDSFTSGAAPILLLVLLLPSLGLVLRSPLVLGVLPALGARLTAPEPNYWGLWFHYNGTISVILAVALIDALRRNPGRRASTGTLVALSLAITLCLTFWAPIGRQLTALGQDCGDCNTIAKVLGLVPDGARVIAADRAAPYLVDRTTVFGIHQEFRDSTGEPVPFDYVVVDKVNDQDWQEAWFNAQRGEVDYELLGEAVNLVVPEPYDIAVLTPRR